MMILENKQLKREQSISRDGIYKECSKYTDRNCMATSIEQEPGVMCAMLVYR
jgi:hypothetical protein